MYDLHIFKIISPLTNSLSNDSKKLMKLLDPFVLKNEVAIFIS